jgi:hypothetical protein
MEAEKTNPLTNSEFSTCSYCGKQFKKLNKHITDAHPEKLTDQFAKIKELYLTGMSARNIAKHPDIIISTSSIVRYLRTQYSSAELEENRKKHISSALLDKYDSGELDFVKEIISKNNKNAEIRKRNSEGVKAAYAEGRRHAWMKGKTKHNDSRISAMSEKLSSIMSVKAAAGELKTLLPSGELNPKWKDGLSRERRNGESFNLKDRNLIKKRANFKCEICQKSEVLLIEECNALNLTRWCLECDHRIPIYNGGSGDAASNGQALCTRCHIEKTKKDINSLDSSFDHTYSWIDNKMLSKLFDGILGEKYVEICNGTNKVNVQIVSLKQQYQEKELYTEWKKGNTIFFYSDEWDLKRDVCKSMISHRIGKSRDRVYARKCSVSKLNGSQAAAFFEKNHISGHVKGSLYFGLIHDGVIVSAISFRKPFTKNRQGVIELARFCSLLNTNVVGGFSKLFSAALKEIKERRYNTVLSYADCRFGNGEVYLKNGFSFTGHTGISYGYTDGFNQYNRFLFRAQNGMSEKEFAEYNGVYKYYGCGHNRYELIAYNKSLSDV